MTYINVTNYVICKWYDCPLYLQLISVVLLDVQFAPNKIINIGWYWNYVQGIIWYKFYQSINRFHFINMYFVNYICIIMFNKIKINIIYFRNYSGVFTFLYIVLYTKHTRSSYLCQIFLINLTVNVFSMYICYKQKVHSLVSESSSKLLLFVITSSSIL